MKVGCHSSTGESCGETPSAAGQFSWNGVKWRASSKHPMIFRVLRSNRVTSEMQGSD